MAGVAPFELGAGGDQPGGDQLRIGGGIVFVTGRGHALAGEFDAGGLAVLAQIIGPGVMAVAGEDDQLRVHRLRGAQETRARGGIAAPVIVIERQAQLRRGDPGLDIVFRRRARLRAQPVLRRGGHLGLPHDRAEADDLPALARLARGAHRMEQPILLLRAHHRRAGIHPRAVAERLQRRDRVRLLEQRRDIGLFGAREQPGFGAEQRGEGADVIGFPRLVRNRHPFAIRLDRRRLARQPIALVRLMVLRAALPAVVGGFVIVPLDDHRP